MEDVEDSFKFALKDPVQDVAFYNLIPYPQTELYEWVDSNNYFLVSVYDYLKSSSSLLPKPVFQTPELTQAQRIEALKKSLKVRKKVRVRSFKNRFKSMGLLGNFINAAGLPVLLSSDATQRYYRMHGKYLRPVYNLFLSRETKRKTQS